MAKSLWVEIQEKPITASIIAICCLQWLFLNQRGWGYAEVGTSYEKVIRDRQYWRLFVSQVSHVEVMHLLFNMSSLWSLGFIEMTPGMGHGYYLKVTAILMVFSKLLMMGCYAFMSDVLKLGYYRHVQSVGYSSVIFGWMSNLAVKGKRGLKFRFLNQAAVPMSMAPFASLVLTSMLIPKSSFFGHLSGILVGYLIGFGYFDWLDFYWTASLFLWIVILMFVRADDTQEATIFIDDVRILNERQIP